MEAKGLSVSGLIRRAWNLYRQHWFFLTLALIAAAVIGFSPLFLEFVITKPAPILVAFLELAKTLLTIWMFLGMLKIYITLAKGEKVVFTDLFKGLPMVLNFLVSQILVGLLMLALLLVVSLVVLGPMWLYFYFQGAEFAEGLNTLSELPKPHLYFYNWGSIAFIGAIFVPIVWMAVRFMLMPFFIVDCYEGPIEALRMSYRASKGATLDLFALLVLTLVFFIIGSVFFGVGLLVTVPIIYLAQSLAYLELVATTPWQEDAS